ncbi:MAG: 16S rRNA (guanine(527)-N(7))-methyltransferase RsmG [Elainellaceae cyanobacterium]
MENALRSPHGVSGCHPDLPHFDECWQHTLGWHPTPEQHQQFQQLYHCILEGNRQFNLTRITEPTEFWEKHLWDSLRGLQSLLSVGSSVAEEAKQDNQDLEQGHDGMGHYFPCSNSLPENSLPEMALIDIGTGAGFPGIPVAIAHANVTVTLLDSTQKKIAFLNSILPDLGIPTAKTLTGRVEAIGRHPQHREHYDGALLRAVAPASVCAEYALPLLKQGGRAILYRGQWSDDEADRLQSSVELLGGAIARVDAFETPLSQSTRHCIVLEKTAKTPPNFPRAVGIPTKDPL